MEPDEEAHEIRSLWHQFASSMDTSVSDMVVREYFAKASWNDKTFEKLSVGICRAIRHGYDIGFEGGYDWSLSRDAYDQIPEPFNQYLLLCAINGVRCAEQHRSLPDSCFKGISARATGAWSLNSFRAEPITRSTYNGRIAWVVLPFVWDDALKQSIHRWLRFNRLSETLPLQKAVEELAADSSQAKDSRTALPYWNGLIAKVIAGHLSIPPAFEAAAVERIIAEVPEFAGAKMHQDDAITNSLVYTRSTMGHAYSIAHELGHIVFNCLQSTETNVEPISVLEAEHMADRYAMESLWNYDGVTPAFAGPKQSEVLLWMTSGLFFYMGVIVLEYASGRDPFADSNSMVISRLNQWEERVIAVSNAYEEQADSQVNASDRANSLRTLIENVVSYCHAFGEYTRRTLPTALELARRQKPTWELEA